MLYKMEEENKSEIMADYTHFRQQLDAALRTLDFKKVQSFLIGQDQWSEDVPADPEYAMWMMIAASPTLQDLHAKAREWLVSHGHATDALAVLGRGRLEAEKRGKQRSFKRGPERQSGNQSSRPGAQRKPGRDNTK